MTFHRVMPRAAHHAVTADGDLVMQIADDADMVGHDPQPLADCWLAGRAGEVEHAVLLVQPLDHRSGIIENQAVARPNLAGDEIAGEALAPAIDNVVILRRPADDGRMQMQGAFIERRGAGADGGAVVKNIGADAKLGQPGDLVGPPAARRAAAGDGADRPGVGDYGSLATVFVAVS